MCDMHNPKFLGWHVLSGLKGRQECRRRSRRGACFTAKVLQAGLTGTGYLHPENIPRSSVPHRPFTARVCSCTHLKCKALLGNGRAGFKLFAARPSSAKYGKDSVPPHLFTQTDLTCLTGSSRIFTSGSTTPFSQEKTPCIYFCRSEKGLWCWFVVVGVFFLLFSSLQTR